MMQYQKPTTRGVQQILVVSKAQRTIPLVPINFYVPKLLQNIKIKWYLSSVTFQAP